MPPSLIHEKKLKKQGIKVIAGVDEAGRGPLAGPVVAAAVILPEGFTIRGIDDSKKLTEHKREELYEKIIKNIDHGLGIINERVIDKKNILQATFLAMNKAVQKLKKTPQHILFDGNRYNHSMKIPQTLLIEGDALSRSIATASILAKVTRDRIMYKYHKKFPQYGFNRHKGYGTKEHIKAIKKYGPCILHRKSFLTTILNEKLELPLLV